MHHEPLITNAERAERVRKALESYNDEYDIVANAIDLLTDLQHYCVIDRAYDPNHRTFDDLLRMARDHFHAEIGGGAP